MKTIKIVLADDQALFVESLKNILEMRTKDLKIVGVAYDGMQALRIVNAEKPDIVLMDVRMPNMDGVESTKIIHQKHPETKIMMLTTFDDDEYVHEALNHGAVGYLLKTTRPMELIASIRAIREGIFQISPTVAAKLAKMHQLEKSDIAKRTPSVESQPIWLRHLTHREKEILKYVLEGYSNRVIGEKLFISEQTVKNHLSIIYSKMDAHSRPMVIRKLIDAGIDFSHY